MTRLLGTLCLLALSCALPLHADEERVEVEALGLSFVLPKGAKHTVAKDRCVVRFEEGPLSREVVITDLKAERDVDAYAQKRAARFEKGPGKTLKQTLRTVDGERGYSWIETKVATNLRIDTCVVFNRYTGTLLKLQLYTELEEFPGRRTIPPSPRDGAPSDFDRRAFEAFYRLIESLDLSKRPKAKK